MLGIGRGNKISVEDRLTRIARRRIGVDNAIGEGRGQFEKTRAFYSYVGLVARHDLEAVRFVPHRVGRVVHVDDEAVVATERRLAVLGQSEKKLQVKAVVLPETTHLAWFHVLAARGRVATRVECVAGLKFVELKVDEIVGRALDAIVEARDEVLLN